MKKKLIYGLAFIGMSTLLTGCHMKHEWVEATCTEPRTCSVGGETEGEALGHTWVDATCTEPKICSVCGETEGEALGHEWQEATYDAPKTCSVCSLTEGEPLPKPYFLEKGIVCEELKEFDVPINVGFWKGDKVVETDEGGSWLEFDNAHYRIGEITSEPAQQEGYLTVTVPYEFSYSSKWCCYNTYSGDGNLRWQWQILCVCDYNTGVVINGNGEKEVEWEGNIYSFDASYSWESDGKWGEWVSEGNIDRIPYEGIVNVVYTITIPEEYDGIVLFIRKDKPDFKLDNDSVQEGGEDADTEDIRLCDKDDPETFICIRLSDLMQ